MRGREILHRARMDALFTQALKYPIMSIVAGPGFGKTTAVSSYLRAKQVRTVWIQLSVDDNMPSHFWETFSQALVPLNPTLAETILALGLPKAIELKHYLMELLLTELKPRFPYALVFDDLHLLQDGPVLDFISQIAQFSTEGVTMIVISRKNNLPNADELFKNDRLSRIDENELFFTKNELTEYFELMDIRISNTLMVDLYRDTEGWPFAVSLAADLLEKTSDDHSYVRAALKNNFDVIADNELFSVVSDELRRFLVQLSLIKHLSPELIREFKNGQRSMDALLQASSLIRYDNYMHVYRIHHLLLRYLENKQDILTDAERLEANEKAACWCMANGYKIDALSYYQATGDYGAIIDIAYTYPPVMPFDVAFTLLEIFEHAPPEVFERHATARTLHTRLIMTVGRVGEAMERMYECIALLEKRPLDGFTSRSLMGLYNNLGFAKLITCSETHDYEFAQHFEKALEYFETAEGLPTSGFQVYNVGPYALRTGSKDARDAKRYIEMIDRSVPCTTVTLQGCGHGLSDLVHAEHAFFRGLSSEAEHYAINCLGPAHEYGQFEIESRALFLLIRVYLQRGKYSLLVDAHAQLESLTDIPTFTNRYLLYEMICSWFFSMIGETGRVESWLKSDLWSTDAHSLFDGLDDSVRAKYYLTNKSYRTLLDFIDSRTARYGISRYILGKVGLTATRAVCLCQLGERTEALKELRRAYELSESNGFDMLFIELGNNMRSLASLALRVKSTPIPSSWLETVRCKAATYAKRLAFVRSCYLSAHNLETSVQLTNKEIDILSDLAQGLSRTEISLAHNVSINTVKTMLQMIYEKLGAESAMEAIRIATTKQLF
jgi:LuxR family maltose regulon positive regulatory protein